MTQELSTIIVPGGDTSEFQDNRLPGLSDVLRFEPVSRMISDTCNNKIQWILDIKHAEKNVSILNMPDRFSANYDDWKNVFMEEVQDKDNIQLIGHSLGAGFILKFLIENTDVLEKIADIHLVSTFCNIEGGKGLPSEFQIKEADFSVLKNIQDRMYFYHGKGDTIVSSDHLEVFRKIFPEASFRLSESGDHFQHRAPPIYFSAKTDHED